MGLKSVLSGPINSKGPLNPFERSYEDYLIPYTNLLAYYRGGVDTIGLSVADYPSIRSELRSMFFVDETTLRTVEAATTLALASEYFNNGWEMCGSGEKGIALYIEDTSEATLFRAYRYFGEDYPYFYYFQNGDSYAFQDGSVQYFQ